MTESVTFVTWSGPHHQYLQNERGSEPSAKELQAREDTEISRKERFVRGKRRVWFVSNYGKLFLEIVDPNLQGIQKIKICEVS